MTQNSYADSAHVPNLVERRWRRYGHDRVYVTTDDGVEYGHIDIKARLVVSKRPEFDQALRECLDRWCPEGTSTPMDEPRDTSEPTSAAEALATPATPSEWARPDPLDPSTSEPAVAIVAASAEQTSEAQDLVDNIAGAAARAKRNEVNAQAPVLNLVARVLGVKTDERAWRVGAKGEEKVGTQLAKLGEAWHRIHAIPVGEHGSDIDHVVIGPGGVFTLNAKRHPGGKAWVADRVVMVNGRKTDYLRNSRFEAARASKLLSAACGFSVAVKPVVVFVDLQDITVKQMPKDVHVITRMRLVDWLRSTPPKLDASAVEAIFAAARLSTTWQPAPPV